MKRVLRGICEQQKQDQPVDPSSHILYYTPGKKLSIATKFHVAILTKWQYTVPVNVLQNKNNKTVCKFYIMAVRYCATISHLKIQNLNALIHKYKPTVFVELSTVGSSL